MRGARSMSSSLGAWWRGASERTPGSEAIRCDRCGRVVSCQIGQQVRHRALIWYRSLRCGGCGHAIDEDGGGLPPPALRARLLQVGGSLRLRVDDPRQRVAAVRRVRVLLGLSLAEAAAILGASEQALWIGTHAECRWLADALAAVSIVSRIERA